MDRASAMTREFRSKFIAICALLQSVRTGKQGRFVYRQLQIATILQRSCGTLDQIAKSNHFRLQDFRAPHAKGPIAKIISARRFRDIAPSHARGTRRTVWQRQRDAVQSRPPFERRRGDGRTAAKGHSTVPTSSIFKRLLLSAAMCPFLGGCTSSEESTSYLKQAPHHRTNEGSFLPALVDMHGVQQRPFDDQLTKAVVLVFTLQDCPIANSYVPTLNKLVEEYGPRGVRMLLVHVDPQLTNEAARTHADEYQIKAPVVIDREHAWVQHAGATRSPEVAVFSPSGEKLYLGRIDDRYAGLGKRRTHVSTHDLRDTLDAILAGDPIAHSKTEAVGCFIPNLPNGE
jgi:hypothetical protein